MKLIIGPNDGGGGHWYRRSLLVPALDFVVAVVRIMSESTPWYQAPVPP